MSEGTSLMEVVGLSGELANPEDLSAKLAEIQQEHTIAGVPYVRLDGQTGEWVGFSEEDSPEDQYLMLFPSVAQTVTVWKKGTMGEPPVAVYRRLLFENPRPISEDEALEHFKSHPDFNPSSSYEISVGYEFLMMNRNSGNEYMFSAKNTSSMNSVKSLMAKLTAPGADYINNVPVLELDVSKFKSSFGSLVHKPEFHVVDKVPVSEVKFATTLQGSTI